MLSHGQREKCLKILQDVYDKLEALKNILTNGVSYIKYMCISLHPLCAKMYQGFLHGAMKEIHTNLAYTPF